MSPTRAGSAQNNQLAGSAQNNQPAGSAQNNQLAGSAQNNRSAESAQNKQSAASAHATHRADAVQPNYRTASAQEERRATAAAIRVIALLNSCVVVVAALYVGQELLVPLTLAGMLAFVLAPLAQLLHRARLPHVAAVLAAVAIAFLIIGLLSMVVAQQVNAVMGQLPQYQANIVGKWQRLQHSSRLVAEIAAPLQSGIGAAGDRGAVVTLAERFARPLLGPLATAALVLVFALVILLYSEDLRDRFVRLVGRHDLHRTIFAMNDAGHRLSRYFLSQLSINAAFGLWVGAALALLGLPGAVLLGLVAMLMRFVPFVGTFVGLVPALALAVAIGPDWTLALTVLGFYAASEIVVSQIVEPLLYGHSTGISPVAVILATSFWALIWGFVGLLIATPLTVCLVVIGRNVPSLAFLDVLLGSESPLLPGETFYQRALEGRSLSLLAPARHHIAQTSRADYYDHVALPGLVLAQRDQLIDTDEDRLDPVHAQIAALLAHLAPSPDPAAAPHPPTIAPAIAPAWRRDRAIICLPARGPLDDLAAEMTAQALVEAGFGAQAAPNTILDQTPDPDPDPDSDPDPDPDPDPDDLRLCCLSVLEEGASVAAIRFFVGRIERRMPGTEIVIGLWRAGPTSPLLAALREESGQQHVILSIGELIAYTRSQAAQP